MFTKPIHIGHSERLAPQNHVAWSTRILIALATLVLLGVIYCIWQILRVDTPIPIPDTPIPDAAP